MENETLDSHKDFKQGIFYRWLFFLMNTARQYFYYCFDLVFMSLGLGIFPDYCSVSDWKPGIHLPYTNCSIQI